MAMSQDAVREALAAGDCIMVTQIAEPESKAGTYYTLRKSGRTVPRRVFEALRDDLAPIDPGLFDDSPPPDPGTRLRVPLTLGFAPSANSRRKSG